MTEDSVAQLSARLDDLARRYTRLRREAWLWRFGTVASLGAIGLVIWWSNHPPTIPRDGRFETVRTRDFSLVDADGYDLARLYSANGATMFHMDPSTGKDKNRVVIAAGETGGLIMLKDQKETTRIILSTPPDGPELELASAAGKPNVLLTSHSTGGHLALLNSNGISQIRAGLSESGLAGISLYDNQERNRANFSLHPTGYAQFSLKDPTSKMSLVTGWLTEWDGRQRPAPALVLVDEHGVVRGMFGLSSPPARDRLTPTIRLQDEKGNAVFSAP